MVKIWFLSKNSFFSSDKKLNSDKFDLFVKIYRFIGIAFYGYYEKESKVKHILFAIFYLIMYAIVLIISSPCLINNYNCDYYKNVKFLNNEIGFKQMMIYYFILDFIGITSSIIFSIRGKQFREIIQEFRELFVELKGNEKNFKFLYLFIILYYLLTSIIFIIFVIVFRETT